MFVSVTFFLTALVNKPNLIFKLDLNLERAIKSDFEIWEKMAKQNEVVAVHVVMWLFQGTSGWIIVKIKKGSKRFLSRL